MRNRTIPLPWRKLFCLFSRKQVPSAANGRNFTGRRGWGEIKNAKRPLSNSSSFIWQHFKCSPFTASRRDSFHSQGRVLCFFFSVLPKYIKAIYCNSRRQTSLLVFLPQTALPLLYVADEFVRCLRPPLFRSVEPSSSLFLQSVWSPESSETIWTCLMDNLKNSACQISLENLFVFSWLGFRKQVVQKKKRTCSLPAAPLNPTVSVLRPLMYSNFLPQAFHVALPAVLLPCIKSCPVPRRLSALNICGFTSGVSKWTWWCEASPCFPH